MKRFLIVRNFNALDMKKIEKEVIPFFFLLFSYLKIIVEGCFHLSIALKRILYYSGLGVTAYL